MSEARPADPLRETPLGVVGVAVGLAALLALALAPCTVRGGALDGAQLAAGLFQGGAPPFGLSLAEAAELPSGDLVLRFERPAGAAEGAEPSAPEVVFVTEHASAAGVAALFRAEEGGEDPGKRLLDWEHDPKTAWHATMRAGEIRWREWRADWFVERAFHAGGTWREAAVVNISQPQRARSLIALWPTGEPVSQPALERLLGELVL